MGTEISENFQGAGVEDDPIFKFKTWPIGGTTNSLSLRAAISRMGGDVNVSRGDLCVCMCVRMCLCGPLPVCMCVHVCQCVMRSVSIIMMKLKARANLII